jgi:hypothetical protein
MGQKFDFSVVRNRKQNNSALLASPFPPLIVTSNSRRRMSKGARSRRSAKSQGNWRRPNVNAMNMGTYFRPTGIK